jgi:hypothetical protein
MIVPNLVSDVVLVCHLIDNCLPVNKNHFTAANSLMRGIMDAGLL